MLELAKSFTGFELSPTLKADEIAALRRAAGDEVCHMGFGQSPFPVAPRLLESLRNASGHKEYQNTSGLPELRSAVKEYYKGHGGVNMEECDVIIAPGSKLILYGLQMAVEGDLLMPVPSWVSYSPQASMLGQRTVKIQAELSDSGYFIDPGRLADIISRARAEGLNPRKIILNSPSNPTGLKIPPDNMRDIAAVCEREDILIISDEIYNMVSFDNVQSTISSYAPSRTVVSTGLSKHLSLGGWRIGIGIIPKSVKGLFDLTGQIASETWSCVPSPIQHACVEAYKRHEDVECFISDCTDIHRLMTTFVARRLKDAGITCYVSQGAFYVYPDFEPFRRKLADKGVNTSRDLADHLANEHGLIALPGVAFGEAPERLTLRLSACDYDGEKALDAFRSGQSLDEDFIAANAQMVKRATEILGSFCR